MKTPPLSIQDALYDALDYDPATGELRWRQDRRRVREGDLAGSISRDGALVVGFMRNVYQASHIAWFLTKGEWPDYQIRFADRDPLNLKFDNLVLMQFDTVYASPKAFHRALKARDYRARKKAERQLIKPTSKFSNVTYGFDGAWSVRSLMEARFVIASFKDKKTAEAYAELYQAGLRYCHLNRAPTFPDWSASIPAGGKSALTLQEASNRFAYDPHTGAIFRRSRPHPVRYKTDRSPIDMEGTPAIEIDATRRLIVRASGRTYGAGMMAWFLHTGDWPKRKQLGYRDGDPKNLRFSNLYLKGAPE